MPPQRQPQGLRGHAFVWTDPNDQDAASAQVVHQPVERRFESFDRLLPPGDKRYLVLAARNEADFCGCYTRITAAMQLEENLGAVGARQDDAIRCCGACELDHGVHDPLTRGNGAGLGHLLLANRGRRLVSAGPLQAACRARGVLVSSGEWWTALPLISSSKTPGTIMTACG